MDKRRPLYLLVLTKRMDVLGELLRKASRHQSAERVSDHEAKDSSVRFLEGNEASKALLGQKMITNMIFPAPSTTGSKPGFGVHVYRVPYSPIV